MSTMTVRIACAIGIPMFLFSFVATYGVAEQSTDDSAHFRFLFCSDKNVLMELSKDYYERVPDLEELDSEAIPWSWVEESKGGKYVAYFLDSKSFESVTLNSLARFPSGDGGIVGIAGLVDTTSERVKDCYDYAVIGFTCDPPVSADFEPVMKGTPLPKSLKKLLQSEGGSFAGLCYGNKKKHAPIAIVTQKIAGGKGLLRIFYVEGHTYTELTFPADAFRVGKSLLIDDPDGETDVTPHKGELTILPDIDGNGYPEFLIDETATMVFSIDTHDQNPPTISLRRRLYFGP